MSISPDTFETVLNVFSKKYGSFSQTKSTLQNGFGARFEQVQAVWSKKGQVIQIKRFEDRENGSVIMVDEKLHAVVLKQAKVATPGI